MVGGGGGDVGCHSRKDKTWGAVIGGGGECDRPAASAPPI